jgi:replicative DNA helicase
MLFEQELVQLLLKQNRAGLDKVAAILRIKAFYISWHTVVYKKKQVKQEKNLRKL